MGQHQVKKKSEPRWEDYVWINDSQVDSFWKDHLSKSERELLYILGKGFDIRMNFGLEKLLGVNPQANIEVMSISFDEGPNSPSIQYKDLVEKNNREFMALTNSYNVIDKKIQVWKKSGGKKRRIGDRQASGIFTQKDDIKKYSDIIVDISSLPRGIYFSLIGKLLALIDNYFEPKIAPNLFVLTSENADLDSLIIEKEIDEDIHYPHGFGGKVELESKSLPIVWLPLLGENKHPHFEMAHLHLRPNEICPLLPFPSKNPRRSDTIFQQHSEIFFDVLRIEPQNIMFVHEQNPFEVYMKLIKTISNYNDSLSLLQGCKSVISTFSSKLLSVGALLAAYEFKDNEEIHVGISNIDSFGYEISDVKAMENLKDSSGVFVSWLTGNIYC